MLGPGEFRFLNRTGRVAAAQDWNHPRFSKLWLYNLHYFDDLNAEGAGTRSALQRELIGRWIGENPPGQGNGWEPYPCSLRIVNWIQWAWSGNALDGAALQSLAVQSRWLLKRLEFHLLGNHLWANAKALCFAGAFFSGPEAEAWRREGVRLLERELAEQILADGGHFERSPMYHAIILCDVLDLLQLAQGADSPIPQALQEALRGRAQRMLRWLRVMSHPDGGIAFFNDATFGIAPSLAELQAYAVRLGLPPDSEPLQAIERLGDSGFVRLQSGRAVLLADVGSLAPDYIPGHAHAGTLSFELSVDGIRTLVNSGISTYENDTERLRQRGTAAHNTVMAGGCDSSEVWSAFRVGRRARVTAVAAGADGGSDLRLTASHDGYRRAGITHRRDWCLSADGLVVEDTLLGASRPARAFLRFAPDAPALLLEASAPVQESTGSWHPGFGLSQPVRLASIAFDTGHLRCRLSWQAPT